MKKNFLLKNILIISMAICLLTASSRVYAASNLASQKILDGLKEEGRTEKEIKVELEKLGYDADEYLGNYLSDERKNTNLQSHTLTIKYIYSDGTTARPSTGISLLSGKLYSISSPKIPNYTPNKETVSGIMGNSNKTITVTYTTSIKSSKLGIIPSDLSIELSSKNYYADERIKIGINTNEGFTGKIYFPKIQYYNNSTEKRTNIDISSNKYVSDYGDALKLGYVKFSSSDKGNITISKFIKLSKTGKYRIYAEDPDGNEDYVQFIVEDDNEDEKKSNKSKLTISSNTTSLGVYKPIDVTIKSDDYVGKILLYAKYRELTSSYRITLDNTSNTYFSDYSDIWEDGYYKMKSSDNGKKKFSDLVEFKKIGAYRIYAEDEDGYIDFIQIYVNSDNSTNSNSNNNVSNKNSDSSSTDNDLEELIKELLNTGGKNSSITQNNIEWNKENIEDEDEEIYTSRSCKKYRIQYNTSLGVFTSPDLKKNEYFINKDYLKRYIDSKNPQKENCPQNSGWISTFFKDNSDNPKNYIAPNGKVYFISEQNGYFTSSELNNSKNFNSISALKYFIRDKNPLIGMSI